VTEVLQKVTSAFDSDLPYLAGFTSYLIEK